MGCCKCEEYGWKDEPPLESAYSTGGDDFCIFHAPKDEKWKPGGKEKYSGWEFNNLVFERIAEGRAGLKSLDGAPYCDLSGVIFPEVIRFNQYDESNPLPKISFDGATFSKEARFPSVSFNGSADFSNVTFMGKAFFSGSSFCKEANFTGSKFYGETIFSKTKFIGLVAFSSTAFGNIASFLDTKFCGSCLFVEAIFKKQAAFQMSNFLGKTKFINTQFRHLVYFHKAVFHDEFLIRSCTAQDRAIKMHVLRKSTLEQLDFSPVELSMLSFLGCQWPMHLGLETHGRGSNSLACEELYRAMKQRAAGEHDQPQVSHWHFREKLMQLKGLLLPAQANALVDAFEDYSLCCRTRLQAWWELLCALPWRLRRSLLFMYWTCSGFGERPRRAAVCLFVLAMLPLFFLVPLKLLETGWSPRLDLLRVGEVIAEWVRCMPLVKLDAAIVRDAPLVSSVRAGMSWLFQVVIAIQAALFALAVRNRFRR